MKEYIYLTNTCELYQIPALLKSPTEAFPNIEINIGQSITRSKFYLNQFELNRILNACVKPALRPIVAAINA